MWLNLFLPLWWFVDNFLDVIFYYWSYSLPFLPLVDTDGHPTFCYVSERFCILYKTKLNFHVYSTLGRHGKEIRVGSFYFSTQVCLWTCYYMCSTLFSFITHLWPPPLCFNMFFWTHLPSYTWNIVKTTTKMFIYTVLNVTS